MRQLSIQIKDNAVREAQAKISQVVKSAGGRAFLIGGCVRDAFLGLDSKDLDIEVYGITSKTLVAILSPHFSIDLVGEAFSVFKLRGLPIDISLPRRESKAGRGHRGFRVVADSEMTLEEAGSRRDFSMNAVAFDPISGEVFDPFGGLQDLESGILRHTSSKFGEDPLRVLRGMQLAGRYSLSVVPETVDVSKSLFTEYGSLAIERIWGEWYKWASQSVQPSAGLRFLHQCEWLQAYPELLALKGCPQDIRFHPEGDVWIHTLHCTDQAARIAQRDALDNTERAILVLASLCHDLGKPTMTKVTRNGVHSRGHAETEDIYRQFLSRIGAPKTVVDRVTILCRYHLAHLNFGGSSRYVRKLALALDSVDENIEMLARLVEADQSARPPLPSILPEKMKTLLKLASDLEVKDATPKPILMGRHLIELGVSPGPELGKILQAAFDAQLDGTFDTLETAREWVMKQYFS